MSKRHRIKLDTADQEILKQFLRSGKAKSRCLKRALALDGLSRGLPIEQVKNNVGVSLATVYNIFDRFESGGVNRVIKDIPAPGQPPKLQGKAAATLIALASSKAPDGYTCWTMQLLADKLIELGVVDSITDEGVRLYLKKANLSPGLQLSGALPM